MHKRKFAILAALLLFPCLIFPAAGAETTHICHLEELPDTWLTYGERTGSQQFLLDMTMEPVAKLGGAPRDVTAQYAGDALVPEGVARGYAFAIDLEGNWEDGTPVTADQVIAGFQACWEENPQSMTWLANAGEILAGETPDSGTPVSLEAAGYANLEAAREAGFQRFYLNVGDFWGLEVGWLPIDSAEKLRDGAMPSGMLEYYVNPAYLYRNYLAPGTAYERWQGEFLGVCLETGTPLTTVDLGIRKTGDRQVTFFLAAPTTPSALAVKLSRFYPQGTGSCGPYRVEMLHSNSIFLVKNEAYTGPRGADYPPDLICRKAP